MSYSQIIKHLGLFLILFSTLLLLGCGGGSKNIKKHSSNNYRLVSIDIDEGSNDSIDYKLVYKYDNNDYNFKIEKTNFSNNLLSTITTKTFDSKGNILTISEKYNNPDNKQSSILRLWTFTYSQSGQVLSKKFQDFKQNIFEYWIEDKNIRTSYSATGIIISINRFTTDKHGNKLSELIDINNNGKADKKVINTYNDNEKLLTSITTDLNNATQAILKQQTRRYDAHGNIISITTVHPSTNAKQQLTKYQYSYDIYGNILTSTITFDSAKTEKRLYVWEEIAPPVSFVGPILWAGTGCKAGHVSISGKNTDSLSILFDAYDAGKDSRSGLKRSACSISITIKVLPGYRISQLTTDWEGYTEGQGELKRKYFLAGQPYTTWLKNVYNNPEGDNFSQRDDIYHNSFATGCRGKEYIVRIDSQIKTMDKRSYMAIDSTDLHGNVQFLTRFKQCL